MFIRNRASRARHGAAFTLVELLVVIGIISVLVGILLPTLSRARAAANTVKCSANLRSVGQGIAMYVANYRGTLPNSYIYEGMTNDGVTQTPAAATSGYVHWSYHIYGTNQVNLGAFTCPSLNDGGLAPTNPAGNNFDPGQVADVAGVVDKQVPRLAYTLNEALCGRNKFVVGYQGAVRVYQFIKAGTVKKAADTILGTEFVDNWRVVSDAARSAATAVCKSHRPVHGLTAGGAGGSALNMELVPPGATIKRVTKADLDPNPSLHYFQDSWSSSTTRTRLDWVGRNHGAGSYERKKTNFLYLDGHVETKHIEETLQPFQWGQRFYTLNPTGGY